MNAAFIMARLPTACVATSLASCVCYHSHVEADFHDHNYSNVGGHREINAWWREGDESFNTDVNPALMAHTGSAAGGEIQLGFIRPAGKDASVVVEELTIEDRRGKPGAVGVALPLRLPFKKKDFPICGVKGQDGPVTKHYAEFAIRPEVSIAAAPYRITLRGHYRKSGGAKERIDTCIVMDLKRERELSNIADCWP